MKLLLTLSARHVFLQLRQGQQVRAEALFSQQQSSEVRAFLQQHVAPCQMLVDLVEEDFFPMSLPDLPKPELSALLQRRLEARYPGATLRQARLSGRAEGGAQQALLSALTNPGLLQPWLEMLSAENIPLLGIYSLALLGVALVGDCRGSLLLVSFQGRSGLRQSYFREGQLQFSRLSPLFDPADWEAEVARTVQFLRRGQPELVLSVRWLSNASVSAQLPVATEWQPFPPCVAEMHHDVTPGFMEYLVTHPQAAHYLPATQQKNLRTWYWQRGWWWSGVIWLLLSMLWSGYRLATQGEAASLQRATQEMQREMQALPERVSGIPAAEVQAAVAYFRRHASGVTPHQVLQPFSQVWSDFPDMVLDEFSWQQQASGVVLGVQAHLLENRDVRATAAIFERLQQALQQQGYRVQVTQAPYTPSGEFVLQLERP